MSEISRQLMMYRDRLANFSRRNKELFYRENRTHSINLSKILLSDSNFEKIISKKFNPLRFTSENFQNILKNSRLDLTEHFVLNEIANSDLIRRLEKLKLADSKFQNEFGISGAWLLGPFLCWREGVADQIQHMFISPLFKIPVDFLYDKKKRWQLVVEDASLQVNPSLQLIFKQKLGILIPDQFESDSPEEALKEFQNILALSGKSLSWMSENFDYVPKIPSPFKIIRNEEGDIIDKQTIDVEKELTKEELKLFKKTTNSHFTLINALYIDQLNASKAVLFHDYETILENINESKIINELFQGSLVAVEKTNYREQIKSLDSYQERENFFVVNVDSTQHRAIDQVSAKNAVIIQGPPGTGKSQTITNIIAKHLATGKKILFVSAKRAALDVVYSRLQQANIASQAVLIHSSDNKLQDLYNSFLELSTSEHDESTDEQWVHISDKLDHEKLHINKYFEIMESIHRPSNLTISDLFSKFAQYSTSLVNPSFAKFFSHLSYINLCQVVKSLDDLQDKLGSLASYKKHPWLCRKHNIIASETLSYDLHKLLNHLKFNELQQIQLNKKLKDVCAVSSDLIDLDSLKKLVEIRLPLEWLPACQIVYQNPDKLILYRQRVGSLLEVLAQNQNHYESIKYTENLELINDLENYYSKDLGFFDCFSSKFWKFRALRKEYCPQWDGKTPIFTGYRKSIEAFREFLSINNEYALPFFSTNVSLQTLQQNHQLTLSVLQQAYELSFAARNTELIHESPFHVLNHESCPKLIERLHSIFELVIQINKGKIDLIKFRDQLDEYFTKKLDLPLLGDNSKFYKNLFETVQDLDRLDRIDAQFMQIQKITESKITSEVIFKYLGKVNTQWSLFIKEIVLKTWLDQVRAQNPDLRLFDSISFEKKRELFRTLEDNHRLSAREIVHNTFAKRWNGGDGESEGLALIKKEGSKYRRILPPRKIMEKGALSAMMKLKPCWLMSPLSISQILPLKSGLFDTIIFDEASQVRVEEALPSIFRANSMVVVGDPKQMPPTNFFSSNESSAYLEDEEEDLEMVTSILDLASQIYPSEILEWHYRSRVESLISFSNWAFYGGRLIAVPNPHLLTEGDAVRTVRVTDGYFNQKDGNAKEALALVNRLGELLIKHSDKSFGVIAMGQAQVTTLEEALENKARSDAKFRVRVERARSLVVDGANAGLFVKNLENVQGDERDIILISFGYAPSQPGKKLHLNFGPLSKQGGGRRLNVAITRAKQNIEVFHSFDPQEIPSDEQAFGKNPDLALVGRYLKYATAISEQRLEEALKILKSFGVAGVVTNRKRSHFSKDVHRRLEELGYQVSSEIGSCGFFIDLGIHHPVVRTNFILGIECDGALFHSTPYARDRDKIRQDLLESRGWKIIRVWSQDWSKNWKAEVHKIDLEIKSLLGTIPEEQRESPYKRKSSYPEPQECNP